MICILLAQTVGNPLPSAFFEEQITGGRHPNDDKRYTIGTHATQYYFMFTEITRDDSPEITL